MNYRETHIVDSDGRETPSLEYPPSYPYRCTCGAFVIEFDGETYDASSSSTRHVCFGFSFVRKRKCHCGETLFVGSDGKWYNGTYYLHTLDVLLHGHQPTSRDDDTEMSLL